MAVMSQPWKHPQSGIYYFRRDVPKELRGILGKREWKVSLKSKDLAAIRSRHAAESVKCEEAFQAARDQLQGRSRVLSSDAPKLADRWARGVLDQWEADPSTLHEFLATVSEPGKDPHQLPAWEILSVDLDDSDITIVLPFIQETLIAAGLPVPLSGDPAREALRLAFLYRWRDLCIQADARHRGDWRASLELPLADKPTASETKAATAAEKAGEVGPVSEAFAEWSRRKRVSPSPDEKLIGEYGAVIDDFIELHGDLPLDQIGDAEVWDFAETLVALPKDKRKAIRDLPLLERIRVAEEDDMPRVSPKTVKKKMRFLGSVLSTGKRRCKFTGEEPVAASGITAHLESQIGRTGTTRRMHYSRTEMVQVFSSPLFTGQWAPPQADYGEALRWIPLILAYSGARLGEIAALYAEDIRQDADTGAHYIDITSHNGEAKKTANSIRQVPIHPDLIALGLLDYAASQPKGHRLFPKMGDPKKNGRGAYITRAFREYLDGVVKLDDCTAPPLHGFRHAFTTYGSQAGIPEDARRFIQGHRGQKCAAVSDGYNGKLLGWLADEMKKFPSIARDAGLLPTIATP